MPPDLWAAANRVYGPETGCPGPRDPQLTPYIVGFQRAFADPRYRRIVLCTGAQVGKTEALLDLIGERLDTKPAPIIYVGPSREFVTSQFEPRLVELFRQSASLRSKVLGGLGAKVQRQTLKRVAGTRVRLAHAGSSTALKSDPGALCLVDEVDEMLYDVRHQGSPLELAEARGATYADFVVGITSTPSRGNVDVARDIPSGLDFWQIAPTEDLESPIWSLFQSGTRHHWCWPCIHCHQYFVPRFALLRWPEGATPAEARRAAFVECPNCGGVFEEQHKTEVNRRGRYVAPGQAIDANGNVTGDPCETSTASFWVSGLCSPFQSFSARAETHVRNVMMGDMVRIRTGFNTAFGELYSPGLGETPEWGEVLKHCGDYKRGEVPDGVLGLVMTCDIQRTKIYVTIRGWGARATSSLIDWGVIYGETHEDAVWAGAGAGAHQ
jgi:phage terminase large subunit GpA-like protein